MSYLDAVKKSDGTHKRRTVLYGAAGVGKTTWASKWPNPVLIPTEDGFRDVDVPAGPIVRTSAGLKQAIIDVTASDFETVIIDSIDWAEKILQDELDKSGVDQGWGKGALEIAGRLGPILALLDAARDSGKHVILLGHDHLAQVVRPDGKTYGTRTLNLSKHAARRVCEWADEVLYVESDVIVKSSDSKYGGIAVDKGTRTVYTSSSPLFDAKHRIKGLPEKFDLSDVDGYLGFV